MPRNTGAPPPLERVDLRLANGWVCRDRDPASLARDYRITPAHAAGYIALWVQS